MEARLFVGGRVSAKGQREVTMTPTQRQWVYIIVAGIVPCDVVVRVTGKNNAPAAKRVGLPAPSAHNRALQ
jgi:hypothetical protein